MHKFLEAKAIRSPVGYLLPSLMTSTSFLLANSNTHFLNGTHLQPLNLYTMSVSHLGTEKLPATEIVLTKLCDIDIITKETLASLTASSRLVKTISKQGKAFVVSPELFDILNKLLKNDEDNATSEIQLWSGESASYHFTTMTREIESNTAFSLLESTQIQNATLLIFRMGKGHGLLDRFLISVPNTRKPLQNKKKKPQNTSKASNPKTFNQSLHPCRPCTETSPNRTN